MSRAGLSIASWRSPADRRRTVVLTGSILLHAAILAPLAWGLFTERPEIRIAPDQPPIFVDIEPRPLLQGETVRPPTVTASTPQQTVPSLSAPTPSISRERPREKDEDDQPSIPSPRSGIVTPPGTAAPTQDAWRVAPEAQGSAIARATRMGAGGCRIMDGRLSAGEQQICDERFNEAAGRARPIGPRTLTPSEQRRDAQFARDGASALAHYEARRRPQATGVGIVGPADCPGSNLGNGCAGGHLDPSMRHDAPSVIRQDSNRLEGPRRIRGLTPPPAEAPD